MKRYEFDTHWPYWGEDCHAMDLDWNQWMHIQNQLLKINIRNADEELEIFGKEKHWNERIYL